MKVKGRIRSTYSNLAISFREKKEKKTLKRAFVSISFHSLPSPRPALSASWPAAFEFAVRTIDERSCRHMRTLL